MVDEATIDTGGFRFAKIGALDDADMLPGGAKYLDLPGILALSAPCPLELRGEGETAPPVVAAAYRAAGRPENLVTQNRCRNSGFRCGGHVVVVRPPRLCSVTLDAWRFMRLGE
jgi:hypothetical protein